MCVYSAYVDSAQKQWPGILDLPAVPYKLPIYNPAPNLLPPTDPKILQEILDIGRRLDRIDKALGLKDCTQEEANKRAFEARLEKLIADAKSLQESVRCEDGCQAVPGQSAGNYTGVGAGNGGPDSYQAWQQVGHGKSIGTEGLPRT